MFSGNSLAEKTSAMDLVAHRLSKLINRRKCTSDTRNCLNDHLFRNNREFRYVLSRLTCSKLYLMNLVKHGRSKHFTGREVNQRHRELPEQPCSCTTGISAMFSGNSLAEKTFAMDLVAHRLSKLINRRKCTSDTRNCLNDHLFRNNREFRYVLSRLTCSKLYLMNLVKHGRSKHFTGRK